MSVRRARMVAVMAAVITRAARDGPLALAQAGATDSSRIPAIGRGHSVSQCVSGAARPGGLGIKGMSEFTRHSGFAMPRTSGRLKEILKPPRSG
jgi:hypothetical protein